MKNLLIVDFYNTLHKALAVNLGLSCRGQCTGGLYGFVAQLASTINEHQITHVFIVKDKRPYFRSKDFPDYKSGRKSSFETNEDFPYTFKEAWLSSHDLINEFLDLTKIPLIEEQGFEADDLIADFVINNHNSYDRIIALSNDEDLFQLFEFENFFIIKNKKLFGIEHYKKLHPYLPVEHWIQATAMSGTHNALPGIPRVGVKTAAKAIMRDSPLYVKLMSQHKGLVERNMELIKLPYPKIPISAHTFQGCSGERHPVRLRALINFLMKYSIKTTTAMEEALVVK